MTRPASSPPSQRFCLVASCGKKAPEPNVDRTTRKALAEQAKATLGVLPEKMPGAEADTPQLVALGKALYFEKRLSVTGTQSCNDCHRLDGEKPVRGRRGEDVGRGEGEEGDDGTRRA